MIYSKIKLQMDITKMSRKDISEKLEITPYGFDRMIRDETMKISTFEKLYKLFDVPISYWFEEEGKASAVNEPEAGYDLRREIKELKDTLEILKLLIKKQESEITGLKSQLNKHTSF